jgi:hypothetical protein
MFDKIKKISLILLTMIGLGLFLVGYFYTQMESDKIEHLKTLSYQNAAEFDKVFNEFKNGFDSN